MIPTIPTRTRGGVDIQERIPAYVFSPQEVWTGLTVPVNGNRTRVCKGLLDDWSSWIREQGTIADLMARVLGKLTVQGEALGVGPILRLSVNDAQDIPSIKTEYSDTVPIETALSWDSPRKTRFSASWNGCCLATIPSGRVGSR